MLIEQLSDHVGDMLANSTTSRNRAEFQEGVWQTRLRDANSEYQRAKAGKPRWKRLLVIATAEERAALLLGDEARHQITKAGNRRLELEQSMKQQQAGLDGEEALAGRLTSELSDEWTMLRGYRNGRGETDSVLVGPLGLWAVEVKNRNIRLYVDGDRWWWERLDRRGNVVDTNDATDGSGRSWARQVTDVGDELAQWLRRRGQQVPVRTAVLVLNHRATLGFVHDARVDLVGTRSEQLLEAIHRCPTPMSPSTCRAVVELVRRDHRHHNAGSRSPNHQTP